MVLLLYRECHCKKALTLQASEHPAVVGEVWFQSTDMQYKTTTGLSPAKFNIFYLLYGACLPSDVFKDDTHVYRL